MSTYTSKRCPRCGSVIEGWRKNNEYWRTHIGPAIEVCPKCKKYIRCSSNVEFIMLKKPKLFIAQYLGVDAIKSVLFGSVFGSLFWCFVRESAFGLVWPVLSAIIILFVLHCLALKKLIKDSINRTADPQYCEVLRKMGLIDKR